MLFCTQCASSSTLVPILSIASTTGTSVPSLHFRALQKERKKKHPRTNDPICTLKKFCTVRVTTPELHARIDLHKRRDGVQSARDALHLRRPDVGQRGGRVAVQRGQRDVVKVDQTQSRDARAREHDGGPAADAAAADDDDARFAHARDALFAEEGVVPG